MATIPRSGRLLARRLLPAALLIPLLLGGLGVAGLRAGLYGPERGLWLLAAASVLLFAAAVAWNAGVLGRLDRERWRMARCQAVQYAATRILAEASSTSQASSEILRAVCACLGWPAGAVWRVDREAQALRCADFWHAPGLEVPELEAATRQAAYVRGAGLPGRVWAAGEPAWVPDAEGTLSPRSPLASRYGLHGAFAFPVRAGGEVAGVLEFFHRRMAPLDGDLLAMLSAVGSQLGQFGARRQGEARLRENEARFRALAETAHDAILSADRRGDIVYLNPGAERIFGRTAAEVLGRPLAVLMPERFREALARHLAAGGSRMAGRTVELTGLRKDGSEFPLEASLAAWEAGGERFLTAILRDIADRKQAEAALQRARQEAEAASRAKSEFLANMSHEIRTPMNAILGMADLLSETALTEAQRKYVEIFRNAGDHLLALIDDILDFSRVEAGQMVLEALPFDLQDLVAKTAEFMAVRARRKDLALLCHVLPGVPRRASGDAHRLRQVLVNLLGNAVKFTEKGEIILRVEREPGSADPWTLRFTVADTGIGIPADQLDRLFESFSQLDASTTRKYGGSGLGLAISRRLVTLMGGRIWVESRQGGGSAFHVTLPLGPAADAQAPGVG